MCLSGADRKRCRRVGSLSNRMGPTHVDPGFPGHHAGSSLEMVNPVDLVLYIPTRRIDDSHITLFLANQRTGNG